MGWAKSRTDFIIQIFRAFGKNGRVAPPMLDVVEQSFRIRPVSHANSEVKEFYSLLSARH